MWNQVSWTKSDQVLIRRRTELIPGQEAEFIVLKDPQNQEQDHWGHSEADGGWTAGRGRRWGVDGGFGGVSPEKERCVWMSRERDEAGWGTTMG